MYYCLFFFLCNHFSISSFLFYGYGDDRDLHVLTHSFPTLRSSDLVADCAYSLVVRQRQIGSPLFVGGSAWAGFGEGTSTVFRHCFRSEEHTSELQSLMRISYAVFCLKTKTTHTNHTSETINTYQTTKPQYRISTPTNI